jgi:hypothetical protein
MFNKRKKKHYNSNTYTSSHASSFIAAERGGADSTPTTAGSPPTV